MITGVTFSSFDLFHAGHLQMLREAKTVCDYLIVGLEVDPTAYKPEKNKPCQTLVERFIQVSGCKYVDEVVPYESAQGIIDICQAFPIDIRVLGVEYEHIDFAGRKECEELDIELFYNSRDHRFSTSGLRKDITLLGDN